MKRITLITFILFAAIATNAQTKTELNQLAEPPKKILEFPVEYSMKIPSINPDEWDNDYNFFLQFLNEKIMKTQMGMSYKDKGVEYWVISPSAKPHVQLDTFTTIKDDSKLLGKWRSVCYRNLKFWDSASITSNKIFRTNIQLDQNKDDDVLINIAENDFKLFIKQKGKSNFKKKWSSNFSIENGRYLLLYKLFKSSGGISLIGLDKEGRLIINIATVMETKIVGKYINYYANIEQIILERI